jgi:hypothetical protein
MIAAQPNGFKSALALWYCVTHNLPTLFFSADTDDFTTICRAAAMLTGRLVDEVEAMAQSDGRALVEEALGGLDNIRFCFDPTPSLDDIDMEMRAFTEMWGEPPHLVVIDSLYNMQAESDSEWGGLRDISKAVHHMARNTEAAFWILHHVSENDSKPGVPPSRRAILGKISQIPELIITLAAVPAAGLVHISCVKNRQGMHDATGEDYVTAWVDFPRMQVYESAALLHQAKTMGAYS